MKQTRETQWDRVVIIIPSYNEGAVIKQTIDAIPLRFKNIVCIDDGSTDESVKSISQTRAQLVQHSVNLGQGASLQTGLDYALQNPKLEYFVTYDADGQHNIDDVERMLRKIQADKLDIVLGSRFMGKAQNLTRRKKRMLKLAVAFMNAMTGVKLTDAHNGLRVFNRYTAENLNIQMPDFAHASEIIERIAQKQFKYEEVPVTITYTKYSRGKGQTMINSINIFFDVVLNRIIKL